MLPPHSLTSKPCAGHCISLGDALPARFSSQFQRVAKIWPSGSWELVRSACSLGAVGLPACLPGSRHLLPCLRPRRAGARRLREGEKGEPRWPHLPHGLHSGDVVFRPNPVVMFPSTKLRSAGTACLDHTAAVAMLACCGSWTKLALCSSRCPPGGLCAPGQHQPPYRHFRFHFPINSTPTPFQWTRGSAVPSLTTDRMTPFHLHSEHCHSSL